MLAAWVSSLWPAGTSSPLHALLVDGVIGGVGGVILFLPNILLLFFGLAWLEGTGYLARAAFLTDRLMHRFGLGGRSLLPMMRGLGCSISGIPATRTLDDDRNRLTTMLVLPLMSCGARLPIWMLLIPAFFAPSLRAPMLWRIDFDWKIGTARLGARAAKEVFVAQMGIAHALGKTDEGSLELRSALRREDSPLVGLSLLLLLLIAASCVASLAVRRRKSGSWKWAALQFGGLGAVAYAVALMVFQTRRLLGLG